MWRLLEAAGLLTGDFPDRTLDLRDAVNLSQFAGGNVVHQAMNINLTRDYSFSDAEHAHQGLDTLADVQLDEQGGLLGRVLARSQLGLFLFGEQTERKQPWIENAQGRVGEGGSGTTAGGVSAEDEVAHLEVADPVLEDSCQGEIGRVHDVGNVAVGEDAAWLSIEKCRFRATGICAADP